MPMPPLAGSSWLAEFDAVASVSSAHLDNHTRNHNTATRVSKAMRLSACTTCEQAGSGAVHTAWPHLIGPASFAAVCATACEPREGAGRVPRSAALRGVERALKGLRWCRQHGASGRSRGVEQRIANDFESQSSSREQQSQHLLCRGLWGPDAKRYS